MSRSKVSSHFRIAALVAVALFLVLSVRDVSVMDASITSPDGPGFVGENTSIVLDASGFPVVSYRGDSSLKVLHCGNADCTAGNSIATIATFMSFGATSIALDGSGFPVVSFEGGGLKVLHCGNANCTAGNSVTTADAGGAIGDYSSLALDGSGFPVVSYWESNDNDLRILHCGNANCTAGNSITTPDTDGNVGAFTSLALDAAGFPVVSYLDVTNFGLKVLHCGNADCSAGNSITLLDTGGMVGVDNSLALDASGFPVVSYYDLANEDLKVLRCGDPDCTGGYSITSPDTAGDVGEYTSVVMDAFDTPVVSYYDATNFDLKLQIGPAPKATKPGDTDGDGCADAHENGPDEALGAGVTTSTPGTTTTWLSQVVLKGRTARSTCSTTSSALSTTTRRLGPNRSTMSGTTEAPMPGRPTGTSPRRTGRSICLTTSWA